ncbi:MAG: chemotaxis protein CheB [Candidatus Sumerlaeia bacterium]
MTQGQDPEPVSQPDTPQYIVGIGASAGGLEAIAAFFENMPPKNNFSFVVIQHLSPDYKSMMVELLSKRTDMRVQRAEDGMPLKKSTIYLISPKKNLEIVSGRLSVTDQHHNDLPNLPIDIFLRSLAHDQGEKAIAIILSGTGSDGTRGVRAVKESGGMVMVQSEESAKFDGMPRAAISTGLVDYVLSPEKMPEELQKFVEHPSLAGSENSRDNIDKDKPAMENLFGILHSQCNIDFTHYKQNTVNRRIDRRMSVNQINDIDEYVQHIYSHPAEVQALCRELLIGVTRFFRDREVWDKLQKEFLPELIQNAEGNEMRFWVAGCSTGEEAYTLAIVTCEVCEELGVSPDFRIFATDIDRHAIQQAGLGIYPESIAADVDNHLLQKYFYRRRDSYQVSRNLREKIVFAQHNIIKDPPFTNISMLTCRNLLIYLQPVLQQRVIELFDFSLLPDALLMLGTSETVSEVSNRLIPLDSKSRIYKARGSRRHTMQSSVMAGNTEVRDRSDDSSNQLSDSSSSMSAPRFRRRYEEQILERFLQTATEAYLPLAVIVNESLEVLHVIGDSSGYFKLPSGKATNNIGKMAIQELAIPLATGIQKVFDQGKEKKFSNIRIQENEGKKNITLLIKPLPCKKTQEPLVAVFIREMEQTPSREGEEEVKSYDVSEEAQQRIRDLEQDLQFTQENLQATIEELETSNEELQATNEELLASNEELQSTNEELQSANEELHTVNAEYQSKIIELTELNNDVDNLMTASKIGKLLIDENKDIRRFSPEVKNIFDVIDRDIGCPISRLGHHMIDIDFLEAVDKVLNENRMLEKEVETENGDWYLMRIVPYQIAPETYAGAVCAFINITEQKKAQAELVENEARLKNMAQLAKVGSWNYDVNSRVLKWSDEVFKIFELDSDSAPSLGAMLRYFLPDYRAAVNDAFDRAIDQSKSFDIVAQIANGTGRRPWIRIIGSSVSSNGKTTELKGAIQDISELKNYQTDLLESEKNTDSLMHLVPAGLFLYQYEKDTDSLILIDGNKEAANITDLDIAKNQNRDFTEIWPNTKDSDFLNALLETARTGKTFHTDQYQYEDNQVKGVYRINAFKLTGNRLAVSFENIQEKQKILDQLAETREMHRYLFENMSQGVVYHDDSGQIIAANPAAAEILGLSLDELMGKTSYDPRWRAISEDGTELKGDEHPAMIALRTGKRVMGHVLGVYHPKRQETRWIRVNAFPRFDADDGSIRQIFVTFEDFSEEKKAAMH